MPVIERCADCTHTYGCPGGCQPRTVPPRIFMCLGCWHEGFPIPCRPEPWRCGRHGGTIIAYEPRPKYMRMGRDPQRLITGNMET